MSTRVGDYICGELLGKGSTAKVYKGQHIVSGEVVAIKKVSKRSVGPVYAERMVAEIALARKMQHLNIVGFRDYLETDHHLYLVSEYCNAGDLAHFLKMTGPLPPLETKYYLAQIRDALRYLSDMKIVHRDLKPQNLLVHFRKPRTSLRYDYQDILVKIADFGLAKEVVPNMTSTLCGSPLFLAPEILLEGKMHARSDLWSLGVVLYKMLYGHYPCGEPNGLLELTRLLERWNLTIPKTPKSCLHQRDLLRRLLRKNPDDRIEWAEFFDHPWLDCDNSHCDVLSTVDSESSDDSSDEDEDRLQNKEAAVHWQARPLLLEDYCDRSSLSLSVPIAVPVRHTVTTRRDQPSITDSVWNFIRHYISA
jgi:serine/threonine protein kinase